MKQYTFLYRGEYSTLIGEIHRPLATIYLQAKNKKWRGFTLFSRPPSILDLDRQTGNKRA